MAGNRAKSRYGATTPSDDSDQWAAGEEGGSHAAAHIAFFQKRLREATKDVDPRNQKAWDEAASSAADAAAQDMRKRAKTISSGDSGGR